MRLVCALLLSPVLAHAGVVYDVGVRPMDQSSIAFSSSNSPSSAPVFTRYHVEEGKVRVGAASAKTFYLFEDQTMDVVDTTSRTVHVLHHATLSQVAAHYADAVRQLEDAAANASPDERIEAQRKAADMKEVSDRLRQPVLREYRETVRFESVEGHACRIWEEREGGAKRLELCIAPVASLPGGADILNGMKTLSQFRQGSNFAWAVDFGLSEWWRDFATVGGVPILIREYKYDSEISETVLSAIHQSTQDPALFAVPDGYQTQDGPDYAQWYVR